MAKAESPFAQLKAIQRVSPLVKRVLYVEVLLSFALALLLVVQGVALARVISVIYCHSWAIPMHEMGVFAVASFGLALLTACSRIVVNWLTAPVRQDLRRQLFQIILRSSGAATLDGTVQIVTTGVESIGDFVGGYIPAMLQSLIAPGILLAWFAWTDLWSLLIVSVALVLLPVFMILLGLTARDTMSERWNEQQKLAGYFGDVVRGMADLKAFNRENDAVANLDEVGESYARVTMQTLRIAFLSTFTLELLSSLAVALVALVLGIRLLNGSLSLSVALSVLILTPEIFLPIRRAAAQYHSSEIGISAMSDVLTILACRTEVLGSKIPQGFPAIEFQGVSLRLTSMPLRDTPPLTAKVAPGGLLTIAGVSGIGKTTLLKALAGLIEPTHGLIIVNGIELSEYVREEWWSTVGYLPQRLKLPGRTVRDVLSNGIANIPEEKMLAMLERFHLPFDLDREIGEGGSALSAGQRRRLAFARTLLQSPDLLILDEPLAHLDDESAEVISKILEELPMTRVVASHKFLGAGDSVVMGSEALR